MIKLCWSEMILMAFHMHQVDQGTSSWNYIFNRVNRFVTVNDQDNS